MFRLFLRKKLLQGDGKSAPDGKRVRAGRGDVEPNAKQDRRVFARYVIDHKHLTLMNQQDILLVREISAKGFSTEVSQRGFERLTIGDVYDARVRYLGEIYDLNAKVIWKKDAFVGFEIVKASSETLQFIKRLLKPVEIAWSLAPVEAAFMQDSTGGKRWYHGDDETDLYVWHDAETNDVSAWQLASGNSYVEWNAANGLTTGALVAANEQEARLGATPQGPGHMQDGKVDSVKRQFAIDVIMAMQYDVRAEILDTLA